jgi:hypothetical protein
MYFVCIVDVLAGKVCTSSRFFAWWPMKGEGKILFTSFDALPSHGVKPT